MRSLIIIFLFITGCSDDFMDHSWEADARRSTLRHKETYDVAIIAGNNEVACREATQMASMSIETMDVDFAKQYQQYKQIACGG